MAGQGVLRELLGPLNPYKSDDEEEDCAQEEGEQDSEFVDAEELCSGGIKAGSLPGRMRGERAPAGPGWQGSKKYFRFLLPGARRPLQLTDRQTCGVAACFTVLKDVVVKVVMAVTQCTYRVNLGFYICHLI